MKVVRRGLGITGIEMRPKSYSKGPSTATRQGWPSASKKQNFSAYVYSKGPFKEIVGLITAGGKSVEMDDICKIKY